MYPKKSYLEKRSPSPTFVNISATSFDYNLPSEHINKNHHSHHHQNSNKSHGSMKFAKTKAGLVTGTITQATTLDKSELIYPEDAYSIEFCMPNDVSCKCPPTISSQTAISTTTIYRNDSSNNSSRRQKNNKNNNKSDNNRWTRKTTNYPSDHIEHLDKTSSTTTGNEILHLENFCTPKQLQPQIYDVYSYAYLDPPPPPTSSQSLASSSVLDKTHHTLQFHKHHHHLQQHKQASTSSTTSTTSSSSSTSFMPIYGCGGGPSTSSGGSTSSSTSKSPSRNSIKALLAKGFRNRTTNSSLRSNSASSAVAVHSPVTKNSPISIEKYTFTTRYGTTENLYEEVNDDKIREILSSSSNDQEPSTSQIFLKSLPINSKEEQRRVQNNHFRILDELNLSLEALIMPPTPPDTSPTTTIINNQDNNLFISGSKSVENISSALNNIGSSTSPTTTTTTTIDFKGNIKERFYKTRNKIDCILNDNDSSSNSATASSNSNNGFGDIDNDLTISGNYFYDRGFASTMMMSSKRKNFKNFINDGNNSSSSSSNITMTLISPSSPFKSMKRYFDSSTTPTSSSINVIQKLSPNENCPSDIKPKNNSNNKFWTIRQ